MNRSESFFRQFPELRGADPAVLRELIADRELLDQLLEHGVEVLDESERARIAELRRKLDARFAAPRRHPEPELVEAGFGGSRTGDAPRGSFLATARGWLALCSDRLTQLAAGVAFAGSTEFFLSVLAQAASGASVMRGTPLGVDLIDPDSGAMSSTDECTISTLEPWGVTSVAGGGVRLRGSVAFDFVFEESTAQRFEGGVALACFLANDGIDARCLRAPVTRAGTRLLASFDELLPGVARLPESGRFALRYRLLPPGEAAKALLEA